MFCHDVVVDGGVRSTQHDLLDQRFVQFHGVRELIPGQSDHGRQEEEGPEEQDPVPDRRQHEVEEGEPNVGEAVFACLLTVDPVLVTTLIQEPRISGLIDDPLVADPGAICQRDRVFRHGAVEVPHQQRLDVLDLFRFREQIKAAEREVGQLHGHGFGAEREGHQG